MTRPTQSLLTTLRAEFQIDAIQPLLTTQVAKFQIDIFSHKANMQHGPVRRRIKSPLLGFHGNAAREVLGGEM
jgi:hypothetical protein